MRVFLATTLAAAVALGCGGAPPPQVGKDASASASITLTRVQACQRLLDDLTRNGGAADIATLRLIADHVTAPRLAADARTAVRDMEHAGLARVALTLLRDDCARAGVPIPAP